MANDSSVQRAYLVGLDLETTGLKLEAEEGQYFDEILEKITARTVKINGITRKDVKDKPEFHEVAVDIHRALHGNIWFGHNIKSFDHRALRIAFRRAGIEAPEPLYVIDTLHVFPRYFKENLPNKKLATLMDYFELGQQSHRALDDVNDLFEVFQRIAMVRFLEQIVPSEFLRPEAMAQQAEAIMVESRVLVEELVETSGALPAESPPQREDVPAQHEVMPAQLSPSLWLAVAAAQPLEEPGDPSAEDSLNVQLKQKPADDQDRPVPSATVIVGGDASAEREVEVHHVTKQQPVVEDRTRGAANEGAPADCQLNVQLKRKPEEMQDRPVARWFTGLIGAGGPEIVDEMRDRPVARWSTDLMEAGGSEIVDEIAEKLDSSLSVQEGSMDEEETKVSTSHGIAESAMRQVAEPEVAELAPVLTTRSGRPSWMLSWQGQEFVWQMERGTVTSTVRENGPYNVDSSGRPTLRILVRLTPSAANFVRAVSTLMESTSKQQQGHDSNNSHTPWESPLMPSRGQAGFPCSTIRLKILINGGEGRGASLAYLTRFSLTPGVAMRAPPGIFPPRVVSVPSFAEALPNESLIDVHVRFESYSIPGQRSGLRLVAEEIKMLRHGAHAF